MISLQKVPLTKSIVVLGISDDISEELIELYFDSPKSGGGGVTELCRNQVGFNVTFSSHEGN